MSDQGLTYLVYGGGGWQAGHGEGYMEWCEDKGMSRGGEYLVEMGVVMVALKFTCITLSLREQIQHVNNNTCK